MAYVIGLGLAVATAILGRMAGFDRERGFYPIVLIVVASYYALFAVMGDSTSSLMVEMIAIVIFVAIAIVGFRASAWLVVAGLAGHGVFDFFHDRIVTNPGVPVFWPAFCMAFDVGLAAVLALLMSRRSDINGHAGRVR